MTRVGNSHVPKQYKTKTEWVKALHDQGYTIAEITHHTQSYYSFVHRTIKKYTEQLGQPLHVNKEQRENQNGRASKKQIEALAEQNYTVDEILAELDLSKEYTARVYAVVKSTKSKPTPNLKEVSS